MNLNKELHEAFGHKWNEPDGSIGSVIAYGIDHTMGNPDYVAPTRFLVYVDLIMDTTGKLATIARDWLKGEKDG